jgi:hypothetical protein
MTASERRVRLGERLLRLAYRDEGIPLNAVTLGDLRRVARDVGVEDESRGWLAETDDGG